MKKNPCQILFPVCIGSLLLLFSNIQTKAALTVTPSKLGNVFYTTETVSIPVTSTAGTSVSWTVTDYFGDVVASGTTAVSGGVATITPATAGEIGYFDLALVENPGGATNSTQFTIITTPPTQTNSPYGTQTHFSTATPTAIDPLLVRAGIVNIRDEQFWNSVENPKGTFTWPSTYTSYMSAAASNSLAPLITLDWANQFYDYSGGQFTGPTTTTGLAGFGNYSLQLLNKYGSQVPNVEVWDEYNGSKLSGTATTDRGLYYYDLLQSVSNAIRPTYPSVKIVAGATFPIANGFIKSFMDHGANSYVDIFSVHPYRAEPEGVDLEFNQLATQIKAYNGGVAKPVWATEFSLGGSDASERFLETSYLVRMVAQMQTAGVQKMFYYTVQDDSLTPYRGLVAKADASRGNYLANPVYAAYANTIRQLYGWTPDGRNSTGMASTTYVYQFHNGSDHKYVCWGGSGFNPAPTSMTFTIPTSTATVTDIMGNASTMTASGGKITVPLGIEPIYVTITGGAASAFTEGVNPAIADSVAGYSGTQGTWGWSYGTITGAYNPSGFTALPWAIWNADTYRWTASGGYPFINIDTMHPNSGQCVVRRWTSNTSGNVTISGTITGPGSGSDGVYCKIYVDGTAVYSPALITAGQVVSYSVPNVTIANGSIVDFVENINASRNFDATGWTARITSGLIGEDIGTVGLAGSSSYTSGTYTLSGAGTGLGGTADGCYFLHEPITGDCTITARVNSISTETNAWRGAGVMIRETTAAGSIDAINYVSAGHGIILQTRSTTGGTSSNKSTVSLTAPYWVRLVRSGNTFSAYYSPNGSTWTALGTPQTIAMASDTQVGLVISSWKTTALVTSPVSNLSITTP